MHTISEEAWTLDEAATTYGFKNWANDYFGLCDQGEVTVQLRTPDGKPHDVSLLEVVAGLKERGTKAPVLLRFAELLTAQIARLNEGFRSAIKETGYQGSYHGVYPIKVNQQQQAIEEICRFGRRYHYGLETGTKAELIAALGYLSDPEAYLICNGYKDEEFIDLALRANKMGLRVILVLEMPSELDFILERAELLGIEPSLGIRVRLAAKSCGHWCDSAGDRSVFGLNSSQVMETVDHLKALGKLHCLRMLHFHQGSQVPNIRALREAAMEASRFYVDLVKEGAPMGVLDMGGGLAIDYDGSQSSSASSCNYSMEEYCVDLLEVVKRVTDQAGVANPDIITESGRAIVAYYSVLVFNILDTNTVTTSVPPEPLQDTAPPVLKDLYAIQEILSEAQVQECFNDAVFYREQLRSLFVHGGVTLRERGLGERMFAYLIQRISGIVEDLEHVPEDLLAVDDFGVDFYYGNFSLFQSLPDAWAIDQIFPVMPLHRLMEKPTRRAVIADITCDCDGRLNKFLGAHEIKNYLPVHDFTPGDDYYMGVFLVGAYQETLGDLHNLIGDTNIVSVSLDGDGRVRYAHEIDGDSVADVLSYVEYDIKDLMARFRRFAEQAVVEGRISPKERRSFTQAYEEGLRGYTYFED